MPSKREGTRRVTFFIPDETYDEMRDYISTNYSAGDSYGARSRVISNALSCYFAGHEVKMDYTTAEIIDRTIEEHKETLDELSDVKEDMKNA